MSDISDIEDLLERLRNTENVELADQRDLLLGGREYPEPQVRQRFPIDVAEVTLSREEPSLLDVPVAVEEVAATLVAKDTVAAVVIGARSLPVSNAFELLVQLGAGDAFLTEPDPTDDRYVALVGFFDDDSGEHHAHTVDERGLAVTTAPFGHFTLDAGPAVIALTRKDPNARPVIQLSLVVGESHLNTAATLTLADLSIATIAV